MGTPRTRTRKLKLHSPGYYQSGYYLAGVWKPVGSPQGGSTLDNIQETCDDVIEPPPFTEPHPLLIVKKKVSPLLLHGEVMLDVYNHRRHFGWNPANFTGYQYVPIPSATDSDYWKAKALANLNPFKPAVDIPLFLFELKDFPRMLRQLGQVLQGILKPRDVPGGYLAYQFGWKPLFNDLLSLVNFAEEFQKTRRNFRDAERGARLRRTIGKKSTSGLPTVWSVAYGLSGNYQLLVEHELKIKAWTTARVHLADQLPELESELETLAIRTTLGLDLGYSTLWNMLPWSWMIDYFSNIGSMIEARRGYDRWYFSDMFVMVKTSQTSQVTDTIRQTGSMSFSGGKMMFVRKERFYIGSNPNLSWAWSPMISGYQASILGSLVVALALKRGR